MSRKINRTIGILITDDQLRSSSKYFTYITCYALLARITQRKKKINQFGLYDMFWGCFCDSKLPRMKFNNYLALFEIAASMHSPFCPNLADLSACALPPSKRASCRISFWAILSHRNIPKHLPKASKKTSQY